MVASAQRMDFLTGKEFLNMAKRIFAALLTAALLTAGMAACSGQQQTVEEETVQLPADEEQQEAEPEQQEAEPEQQEAEPEQQESGDVFETLSLTDLDGNEVDSSVFEDYDLTMINIWATFCNPCLSEMPELAELSSEYAAGDNNVQIIGICTDITDIEGQPVQEGVDLAKQIVELTGASYRHLVPDADLMEFLMQEVAVVPTTYFVDSQGKVVGEATLGARDKASWQQEIDARLAMLEE